MPAVVLFGDGSRLARMDVRVLADECSRSIERHGGRLPDGAEQVATAFNRAALLMSLVGDPGRARRLCVQLIDVLENHGGRSPRTEAYSYALQPRLNLARLQVLSGDVAAGLDALDEVRQRARRASPAAAGAVRRSYVVDSTRALLMAGEREELRRLVMRWSGDDALASTFCVREASALAVEPEDSRMPDLATPTTESLALALHHGHRLADGGDLDGASDVALTLPVLGSQVLPDLHPVQRAKFLAHLARLLERTGAGPACALWESVHVAGRQEDDEVVTAEGLRGITRTSGDSRVVRQAGELLDELARHSLYVSVRGKDGRVPVSLVPELDRLERVAERLHVHNRTLAEVPS